MSDIEIEIDGKKLTAKPNQTVIQVADEAGIYIPRFCYHKQLSIAANCRMCLVEVEKSPKTLPACATPVMPGMKVLTRSPKTIEAQRAVMEFLLINHPLDCPICDQGGECELQDLSMGYGSSHSQYDEAKRAVADKNLGPLIATDMTRCIYCTRCVRFGDEIAGMRELGDTYRGEHARIETFVEHAIQSEVSGNVIDLCPVGALTSKPFRFKARAFELDQAPSIAPHDCLGSNIHVHTRYGTVMRVVSHENPLINETWISDRDRFSYTGLYHANRLEEPRIKMEGKWQVVDWQKALEMAAFQLQEAIAEYGADKLGALASPNATLEEFYLLQKMVRALGSPHIDHRLRQTDTQDETQMPSFLGLPIPLADLETCDAILLIGSNIQKEQPLAALRLRKAASKGAIIMAVNAIDYDFNFKVSAKKIVAPHHLPSVLSSLINALNPRAQHKESHADDPIHLIAQQLVGKQNVCILLGAQSLHHTNASLIRSLAQQLAKLTNATIGIMTDGANSAGAWLAGAVPHRHVGGTGVNNHGLNAYAMLEKPRKAYLLLNIEPDLDFANSTLALHALQQAKCVIALSLYRNPILEEYADIILPMAPFTETSGTFINVCGEWQSFKGVAKSFGSSRPAWKILRVLGNFLHLDGFDYESSEAIKHEMKQLVEKEPSCKLQLISTSHDEDHSQQDNEKITRIGEVPIYATDSLVRRAKPLQEAQTIMEGDLAAIRLHPKTAEKLKLQPGEMVNIQQATCEIQLPLIIDARIAENAAYLPGGINATNRLGDLFGKVVIGKVSET